MALMKACRPARPARANSMVSVLAPIANSMTGVPHFDDATFVGRFPVAEVEFHRENFPGRVRMTAFSPFIPHNDRDSSMPAALFSFQVENDADAAVDYTIAGTLGNCGCDSGVHTFSRSGNLSALHFTSVDDARRDWDRGDLAITTEGDGVEHIDYHVRGQWFDSLGLHWREFARPGHLRERRYETPRATRNMFQQPEHGTLARRIRVPAGETRQVRFAITWNYPLGAIYWFNRQQPGDPEYVGELPTWRNYYATQWADSLASGADALGRWNELEGATFAFRDSFFGTSTPAEIIDAVSGTLGVLRSATIIRLEGGELWGWEGQHIREGSCEGSCTHVWNYQQALAYLFPSLERTLRETEFSYNQLPSGGLTFRQRLPLGSGFDIIGPCADGHFGAVIKAYREWKNCGDDAWLRRYWPNIRRAVEYAWSPGQSRSLGPGSDGRPVGAAASYSRYGAVRPQFLADQHVFGGAQGRVDHGRGGRRRRVRRAMRDAREKGRRFCRRQPFQRRLLPAKTRDRRPVRARAVRPRPQGRRIAQLVHGSLLVDRIRPNQISSRRGLLDRPNSRPMAR